MATASVSEPSFPSRNIIDSCFLKLPSDNRYHSVTMQKYGCKTGIDENTKQFEFVLQRLDPPNVYIFKDTLIQFDLVLSKSDGTKIPATAKVAPITDPLGGLIDSLSLS